MAEGRPDIPTALKRAVLVEAGHRCAIPTCRQTPVELAHITPWTKVKEHTFENLIALCPTCHTRYDRGDIDRRAMVQYKANLGLLNSRYTDTERQLLRTFLKKHQILESRSGRHMFTQYEGLSPYVLQFGGIQIHQTMWWMISNLLDDGLVETSTLYPGMDIWGTVALSLTEEGKKFIQRWAEAQPL
ncbi:HNH endonuclease [Streptomyces sp. NBC_01381]|uniref:HNH endonuclease n=1 Tax=Streptomyces sp. NBC_01381 TaxID=2903845 RepID=UPI00224DFE86|nr:HNH endonuclease signature motif containing protein [Streptomyces sp. NBC_01381]MCX4672404.1 HNH endonuclease [Streptomyces sp. NBC_01381]